jgi:hypothetical protein
MVEESSVMGASLTEQSVERRSKWQGLRVSQKWTVVWLLQSCSGRSGSKVAGRPLVA